MAFANSKTQNEKTKMKMLSNYSMEFAFGKLQDEKTTFFRQ